MKINVREPKPMRLEDIQHTTFEGETFNLFMVGPNVEFGQLIRASVEGTLREFKLFQREDGLPLLIPGGRKDEVIGHFMIIESAISVEAELKVIDGYMECQPVGAGGDLRFTEGSEYLRGLASVKVEGFGYFDDTWVYYSNWKRQQNAGHFITYIKGGRWNKEAITRTETVANVRKSFSSQATTTTEPKKEEPKKEATVTPIKPVVEEFAVGLEQEVILDGTSNATRVKDPEELSLEQRKHNYLTLSAKERLIVNLYSVGVSEDTDFYKWNYLKVYATVEPIDLEAEEIRSWAEVGELVTILYGNPKDDDVQDRIIRTLFPATLDEKPLLRTNMNDYLAEGSQEREELNRIMTIENNENVTV